MLFCPSSVLFVFNFVRVFFCVVSSSKSRMKLLVTPLKLSSVCSSAPHIIVVQFGPQKHHSFQCVQALYPQPLYKSCHTVAVHKKRK